MEGTETRRREDECGKEIEDFVEDGLEVLRGKVAGRFGM